MINPFIMLTSYSIKNVTLSGALYLLGAIVIFGAVILFWIKETFGWIPEKRKKRKEAEKQAQQQHRQQDAQYSEYRKSKESHQNSPLDYIDIESADELPNDAEFVKRLHRFFRNSHDDKRVFLCRQKLAVTFHDPDFYEAYAEDLMEGKYCKKDVSAAVHYLKLVDTGEAHYKIYELYADPHSPIRSYIDAADHLATAFRAGHSDAEKTLYRLFEQAAKGRGSAAYTLCLLFRLASNNSPSPVRQRNSMLSSLFWLMAAAKIGVPEAKRVYELTTEQVDLQAESASAYQKAENAYAEGDMESFLLFTVHGAIYGNRICMQNLAVLLNKGEVVEQDKQLAKLCMALSKR